MSRRTVLAALAVLMPVTALADISGTATLCPNTPFSFDTGATATSGSDILFTGASITLQGSAKALGGLGTGSNTYSALNQPTLASVAAAMTAAAITPTANEVIALKTNGGNYAKILITSVTGTSLAFQYTTFGVTGGGVPGGCGSGPILTSTYGTYFGGSGSETGVAVTTDSQGNVIVVGTTTSQTLPGTANAFQPVKAAGVPGNQNVFIAKFDPSGRTLLWATFLGGNVSDTPVAIATDVAGNIYVAGTSSSSNFPGTSYATGCTGSTPFQATCSNSTTAPTGFSQGEYSFVSKVSAGGDTLIYSVQVGGYAITALAVTPSGAARIAANGNGAFLFGVNPAGGGLDFGVYLGGDYFATPTVSSIVLDSAGNIYVGGTTGGLFSQAAANILTTANAYQPQYSDTGITNGPPNGFLIEINPTGSALLYGTYFGPQYASVTIKSLVVNPDGSLYFDGSTNVPIFQATPGAYQSTPGSGNSGYVAKLTPGATLLDSFSYLPYPPTGLTLGSDQTLRFIDQTPSQNNDYAYVILATPTLALVGLTPTFMATALVDGASRSTEWLIGSGYPMNSFNGEYAGNFVTQNAFQPVLNGPSDALLQQITLLNGTIIQTNPAGLQFSVDGGAIQTAPQALNLTPGSHTIAVPTTQAGAPGTQFVFTGWTDGGAASHSINVTSASATYTAGFTQQVELVISTVPVGGGTVTPANGQFYNTGTVVPITSTPSSGYSFTGWIGNVASTTSPSTTVTMSGPQSVAASFTATTGHPPFFNGENLLGGSIYYLQFPDVNLFGYYGYLSSAVLYHQDMGYEAFIPSTASSIYFYDFASGHWWYSSATLFPYLYDFTLNGWIYYFPDKNAGHYTTNPRSFSNLTTGKLFKM